jgi:hypothetical protein
MFNEHTYFTFFANAVGEEARGSASTRTAFDVKPHGTDGHVYFAFDFRL